MALPKNGGTKMYRTAQCNKNRFERGASAFELLLLSVPVCLLSMVVASKLAATSATRFRAQWQASNAAQQGALSTCGGNAHLAAPWLSQNAADLAIASHIKVAQFAGVAGTPADLQKTLLATTKIEQKDSSRQVTDVSAAVNSIGAVSGLLPSLSPTMVSVSAKIQNNSEFPADLLTQSQLAATNWSVNTTTLKSSDYYFKPLADQLMPDKNSSLSGGAAFICNEPLDPNTGYGKDGKESRLGSIHSQLAAWAFLESERFY